MTVRLGVGAAITIALAGACSSDTTTSGPTPAILVVAPDSVFLFRGDSVQLTPNVLDKDSALIFGVAFFFRSSDTTIVRVSNLGLVRSPGPTGEALVTVTGAGLHRDVPVTVQGKPKTLVVNPTDTTIRQGRSYQLRTVVLDSLGDSVASQPRTYQSQNSAIVLVSTSGVVTTGSLAGQTSIRVSSGALTAFAAVTVKDTNIVARVPLAGAPYGVAASVNGVVYVTPIVGPAVRRVNMTTFTLSDSIQVGGDPAQVAFNGAGDTAYVTKRASGAVGIISVATHAQIDTVAVPPSPYPILVTANGSTAYVATLNGWLYKLDLASRARVDSTAVPASPLHLTFGPGDSLLYVSSHNAGTVTEVRAATMATRRTFTVGGVPQAVRVSQDGAELYIADEAGPLRVWGLTGGTEIDTVHTGGGTFGVALTPDGTKLYVTTTLGKVLLVNRGTRTIIRTIVVGGTPRLVAVDPVTGYAVVPNEGGGWVDIVR